MFKYTLLMQGFFGALVIHSMQQSLPLQQPHPQQDIWISDLAMRTIWKHNIRECLVDFSDWMRLSGVCKTLRFSLENPPKISCLQCMWKKIKKMILRRCDDDLLHRVQLMNSYFKGRVSQDALQRWASSPLRALSQKDFWVEKYTGKGELCAFDVMQARRAGEPITTNVHIESFEKYKSAYVTILHLAAQRMPAIFAIIFPDCTTEDINMLNDEASSPLMLAADAVWYDGMKMLLEHGADPHIKDKKQRTVWSCLESSSGRQGSLLQEDGRRCLKILDQYSTKPSIHS